VLNPPSPESMPIRVAVKCETCERIYLVAHPDSAKRIRYTPRPDLHPPYQLRCLCNVDQYFSRAQILPYRVSDYACSRGFAERNQYETLPNRQFSETGPFTHVLDAWK
jgi:hypothetical protein